MENSENQISEFEEMRAQVTLLRQKLDQETIITDELLRDAMKRKANSINANAWISVAASIFVIVWSLFYLYPMGFSWWFIAVTILMMLFCDFFTWRYHKNINKKTMNSDLLTVAKVMKKLKQDYINWMKYAIIMVCFWFSWLAVEFCIIINDWKIALLSVVLLAGGVAIGGFIGLRMHKSVINNADDIINQIDK